MSDWEILETVGTEQEAQLIAGFLESREVPVRVESRAFRQEPVTFGGLAPVRVKVPSGFLDEARRLLEARRHRFTLLEGEGPRRPQGTASIPEPAGRSEMDVLEEES